MLLKDKIAIVTGGTRGIGFATVKAFIEEGAKVIVCGSRQETVDKALKELNETYPEATVRGICPNLTSYEDVKAKFDEALKEFGRVDVLINNAGIADDWQFKDYTEEHFMKVMDINIKGVYNASKAVSDMMMEQQSGVILNTSSMVSRDASGAGIAYPTSKFAVNGFTLSLARNLASYNIRVNAVAPGITYTDMMKAVPEKYIAPLVASIPMKRLGQPEDIANAFVFLASDKASYISGQILHVDGLAHC